MSDNNGLRAALANAHNSLELYHAYGWPDRGGVRAALRVQIDALAATQQPAPSAPEQPSAAVEAAWWTGVVAGQQLQPISNAMKAHSPEPLAHYSIPLFTALPSEPLRVGALTEAEAKVLLNNFARACSFGDDEQERKRTAEIIIERLLATQPTSAAADVDALAQFIRSIDGWNRMGAGVLAEHICEWLCTTSGGKQ